MGRKESGEPPPPPSSTGGGSRISQTADTNARRGTPNCYVTNFPQLKLKELGCPPHLGELATGKMVTKISSNNLGDTVLHFFFGAMPAQLLQTYISINGYDLQNNAKAERKDPASVMREILEHTSCHKKFNFQFTQR